MGHLPSRICESTDGPCLWSGRSCSVAMAQMKLKVSREEFKLYYFGKVVIDMAMSLEGLMSPCIAMQFASPTKITQVVPYKSRRYAERATPLVMKKFEEIDFLLDGQPQRQLIEGRVWPLAQFAFEEPHTLIKCGMSFTTYPLKEGVTMRRWNSVYTNEVVSLLGREFGLMWLFSAVGKGPDGRPMGIVSGLYQCVEAALAVQPKIGRVLERTGALELLSAMPYERTVGVGYTVRHPESWW